MYKFGIYQPYISLFQNIKGNLVSVAFLIHKIDDEQTKPYSGKGARAIIIIWQGTLLWKHLYSLTSIDF